MMFMSSDSERCACGVVRSGLDLKRVLAFPGRQLTVQFLCKQSVVEANRFEIAQVTFLVVLLPALV